MGKVTGFMEFERVLPRSIDPKERVGNWREFHDHLPEKTLREQGARCMDCGVPFCHTGKLLDGGASGCPINNLIPEWNDLVYRGQWREALARLHKTNNFPEWTGRVCPAPCEGSCVLGISEPAVTIKSIECAIVDRGFAEGWIVPEPPLARTGKKVAVVGSGPAGLACAAQLNRAGHKVTVFERDDRIGGLLMYGIPPMKLDKDDRRAARRSCWPRKAIEFVTNTEVGKNYPGRRRCSRTSTRRCCAAARRARATCRSRGASSRASTSPWSSCSRAARACSTATSRTGATSRPRARTWSSSAAATPAPTASARRCATAARAWCSSRSWPRPPDERATDNPWPQWPRVYKMDYGQEEAAALLRRRPAHATACVTKRFDGDAQGNVKALHTVQIEWVKGEGGRTIMKEIPGSEKVWPADLVLLAMGFLGPEKEGMLAELGVKLDERTNVRRRRQQADQRPRHLRRRRHGARPVADRLGHSGRPRRRPRRRPVPDGRDAAALG